MSTEDYSEDYCSYEVAKLLKKKGFDGECMGCYWDSKKTFDINYEPLSYSDGDLRDEVILAPTHQMAMKWLREKDIFIDVSFQKEDGVVTWFYIVFSDIFSSRYGRKNAYSKNDFPTYEEAVEAALRYCLTKII